MGFFSRKVSHMSDEGFVYCLESLDGRATYVGATVNLNHRLRQHNGELAGGAAATTAKGPGAWRRAFYVSGFPDWQACLQFEWRLKQISRGIKGNRPIDRRTEGLRRLLALDRPTSKAQAYADWPSPPVVHVEHLAVCAEKRSLP